MAALLSPCLAVLTLACLPSASEPPPAATAVTATAAPTPTFAWSAEADSYLQEVLDHIRANSVRAAQVNWPLILHEVRWRASAAQTPAQTYPAIRYALQLLGDRHSSFFDPEQTRQRREGIAAGTGLYLADRVIIEVAPHSPAAEAGLRAGDIVEAVNGTATPSTLSPTQRGLLATGSPVRVEVSRKAGAPTERLEVTLHATTFAGIRPPVVRRLAAGIGYVDLPAITCGTVEVCQPYADTAHLLMRTVDAEHGGPACGWIVDLRRNHGGNMYPMLAAVGPVLGDGQAGAFARPRGETIPFGYRGGASFNGASDVTRATQPYALTRRDPPVAVLTSPFTASSGEFILLAFRGRPETRTFGQPTAGLPTANSGKLLRDGALLNLTTALGADRTGRTYDTAIAPDETVPLNWRLVEAPDEDPVVTAAAEWLGTRGCV